MIKSLLKPFLKRFIGLFLSMAFVSILSISLLCSFGSAMNNLNHSFRQYRDEYQPIDAQITTDFHLRSYFDDVANVDGVDSYDCRLTLDSFLRKKDGRNLTSRIYSYNPEEDRIFQIYEEKKATPSNEKINVGIVKKFADNNDFRLGETIQFGYFDIYVDAYIDKIVMTPESMYSRANDYIWSDNKDFGIVYVEEVELDKVIAQLAAILKQRILEDPSLEQKYKDAIAKIDMPDLTVDGLPINFASNFANQINVKGKDNISQKKLQGNLEAHLKNNEATIKKSTTGNNLPYQIYINSCIKQLNIASFFLPVFFYSVTMVVIVLFLNQIIKSMTQEIGIMMSIGIDKKQITGLFSIGTIFMGIFASVFGVVGGYGLVVFLANVFKTTYSLPIIDIALSPLICIVACLILIGVSQLAVLLASRSIAKITPKDAMLSNETKRKPLPKWLNKFIDKAPMNIKLGTNSIAQNPRRFFVSTFSIFSAYVMILLSCFFGVAKDAMITDTLDRRMNFDAQVYMSQVADNSFSDQLNTSSYVERYEVGYFTYAKVEKGSKSNYLYCVALDPGKPKLVRIFNENGRKTLSIKEDGIILSHKEAESLGVKAGDKVKINGHPIKVNSISKQYFNMTQYMSKSQMEALGIDYFSTFFIDVNNENNFLTFLTQNQTEALTVFTSSLKSDLKNNFKSVDIFISILVIFSLLMGFVILTIMSQNSLMEQKRQISVMRSIGFSIMDVSNLWTLQSVSQLLLSSLFAIPNGVAFSLLLFHLASSKRQIYPFVFDWRVVIFGFLFIFLVILTSHIISMLSIKKWNLANNTRSRE